MERLLCILSGMNAGGAETFLMKIYRNLDRSKYQMDFCINVVEKCYYEDEIILLGGRIFRIPSKSDNPKQFKFQLSNLIASEGYKKVLRITSSAMGFWDLKIAKDAGATLCCARSSNSSDGESLKARMVHFLGKLLFSRYVDVCIAPSDLAAIYTFGKKAYNDNKVVILNNALDLDVYLYDVNNRIKIREEFKIKSDELLVGHVGRFEYQKNHDYLIDIFNEIKKLEPKAKLLLVGKGSLQNLIEEKIISLNLQKDVIFSGVRSDIPEIMSAMDLFVFPSFNEGMPNTVIEAQALGLPCVIADTITKQANITGLVKYVSLQDNPQKWAEIILDNKYVERKYTHTIFIEKKYDIQSSVKLFVKTIYENSGSK